MPELATPAVRCASFLSSLVLLISSEAVPGQAAAILLVLMLDVMGLPTHHDPAFTVSLRGSDRAAVLRFSIRDN
ncbi:hypothetical protein IscW_ISCW006767 [Ixodes scapularis]|uniref:Uncharacterized protein n=1 Tax=Ixodes scapularis TaxID=6945 RepID=B7PLW2_IXOSC|nr:hypothetical protein IscW_ISCW006767 [Ixodes scapularis]|eukprot:XP_002434760.1 hypothetical protein IscW_ISCW006767 [Ixodes scapularis]